jgi:hypothetical protein
VFVLVAVGVAGVVATGVTAWAVANSPILVNRPSDAIWRSLFVAAYVAVGAYTWWRRPREPAWPAHRGDRLVYSVASLNAFGAPLAYTISMVAWAGYIVFTGYVYLCFPRGWLESPGHPPAGFLVRLLALMSGSREQTRSPSGVVDTRSGLA